MKKLLILTLTTASIATFSQYKDSGFPYGNHGVGDSAKKSNVQDRTFMEGMIDAPDQYGSNYEKPSLREHRRTVHAELRKILDNSPAGVNLVVNNTDNWDKTVQVFFRTPDLEATFCAEEFSGMNVKELHTMVEQELRKLGYARVSYEDHEQEDIREYTYKAMY